MTQQNKDNQKPEGLSRVKSNQSAWKRFFAKRWAYPAVYLGAAALIIGLMYTKTHDWLQQAPKQQGQASGPSVSGTNPSAAAGASQNWIWPIGDDGSQAVVTQNYFKSTDPSDRQAAELVKYDDKFFPQNGIVLGLKNDSPFTVVAAASGTVSKVDNSDPLMGQTVTVKDDNGYVTYYASLQNVAVKEGQHILQGAEIAKSGNNLFEAAQKNHLHFEIRDNAGKLVNPVDFLPPREGSVASTPVSKSTATGTKPDASSSAGTDPASSDQSGAPSASQDSSAAQSGTDSSTSASGSSSAGSSTTGTTSTDKSPTVGDAASTQPGSTGSGTNKAPATNQTGSNQ